MENEKVEEQVVSRKGMLGPLTLMIAGAGIIFGFIILVVIYAIVLGGFSGAVTAGTVEAYVVNFGLLFFNNTAKQLGAVGTIFGLIPLAGVGLLFVGGYGLLNAGKSKGR